MKVSIFDKEKDDLLREDGQVMVFKNQNEAAEYLKSCDFRDEWERENFVLLNRCKPLIPESMPEFDESLKERKPPNENAKSAVEIMDRAVKCLYLELPESIANDVSKRWQEARRFIDL